jgi:hypothetical protein
VRLLEFLTTRASRAGKVSLRPLGGACVAHKNIKHFFLLCFI